MEKWQGREKETLFFREWFLVFLVLLFGFLLISTSCPNMVISSEGKEESKKSQHQRKIQILLSGEVNKPGYYEIEAGMSLKKFLQTAELKNSADRKALYGKKMLIRSCEISVPSKKEAEQKQKNGLKLR